jgi:hypothetical protein
MDSTTNECINICAGTNQDPTTPPLDCVSTWIRPSGYRLVPGNNCDMIKGVNLLPTIEECPRLEVETEDSDTTMLIVLIVVFVTLGVALLATAGIAVFLYKTNDQFRELVEPYLPQAGSSFSSMYSQLSRGGNDDDDDDDDDAFGLMDDDDFSQSQAVQHNGIWHCGSLRLPYRPQLTIDIG